MELAVAASSRCFATARAREHRDFSQSSTRASKFGHKSRGHRHRGGVRRSSDRKEKKRKKESTLYIPRRYYMHQHTYTNTHTHTHRDTRTNTHTGSTTYAAITTHKLTDLTKPLTGETLFSPPRSSRGFNGTATNETRETRQFLGQIGGKKLLRGGKGHRFHASHLSLCVFVVAIRRSVARGRKIRNERNRSLNTRPIAVRASLFKKKKRNKRDERTIAACKS